MKCHDLILFFLAFTALGCHNWERNKTINGVGYKKVRTIPERRGKDVGAYSIGLLKENTVIDGIEYKGWLHLRDNGVVSGGLLAKDAEVKGILIPNESWVSFDRNANLKRCRFSKDVKIQGFECVGTGGGIKGATVSFYSNGKIKCFFSRDPIVIQGIPCEGNLFSPIELYEDGSLKSCKTADDIVYQGVKIEKGTNVNLDENGEMVLID